MFTTLDLTVSLAYFFAWIDPLVAKPLVIPLATSRVDVHRPTKRLLTEERFLAICFMKLSPGVGVQAAK